MQARTAVQRRRTSLLQANIGVLDQKLGLINALKKTLGIEQGAIRFAESCPIVGASVGQHFRHSMDHMERVANILDTSKSEKKLSKDWNEIHYDIRVRGGSDENDMEASIERIERVRKTFQTDIKTTQSLSNEGTRIYENEIVSACFLLSGDPSEAEFMLSSTVERELGFSAHHAIHHLAMVKIIAIHTLKLLPIEFLPSGFGRAPSTIVYDHNQEQQTIG